MAMEIMSHQVPEEETEAVALATIIFAAGFFLGIGTGMLLGSGAGSGVRGRLKHVVDDLMGDVATGLTGAAETGKHMLTKDGMPGRS
jgi:Mg2+/citrate symporter